MILARMKPRTGPDGRRWLQGETTSTWPAKLGTVVLLVKEGDAYLLTELAPREIRLSEEGLESFLDIEEDTKKGNHE